MRLTPFTRPTVIAAVAVLERHGQASFDQLVLRLELETEIPSGTDLSVAKKCGLLGRAVVQRPTQVVQTVEGSATLAEAVVREAVKLLRAEAQTSNETALLRGLARDGYAVTWGDYGRDPTLRAALPEEIQLPETEDEVRQLLTLCRFDTPQELCQRPVQDAAHPRIASRSFRRRPLHLPAPFGPRHRTNVPAPSVLSEVNAMISNGRGALFRPRCVS